MKVTTYGKEDADPTLTEAILRYCHSQGAKEVTIAYHQRRPVWARACSYPGSVTYEFVTDKSPNDPIAARQLANGEIICPVPRG